ncbi:hypothetical protein CEN50_22830 [Fischerella thermalis CCMEE 5268]|uniref:Glycine zipper domain-containing protein n=1 Tax=Fischerella thermalis CCMEE 5268 TaxID=2019662 RepID=A0A2N6KAE1_9CYAN|nr:hypothetical protein [Fischerella thermalis]PLZ95295.1 hypothetical protein CEN50_22830 [Fischerella thermalis CCMEE 5268]
MEFNFQDVNQGFTTPDFLFNFEPGGDLAPKFNTPPAPNSIENLTFEYINKLQQLNDAVQAQHRIDNIYEQVMNSAPPRDVEILPPENPADVFNKPRIKNITPVEQQQEIADLLERQVNKKAPVNRPSPAEPPVTPQYKTIPLTDPLAKPPTYTPRAPVSGPNPAPSAKPTGLPAPAGRLAGPAIGGVVDFGFRLVAGQDAGRAAYSTAGGVAGSIVGGAIGSVAGPVGTFVGGVVGGMVGGAIADAVYNAAFPPTATPPVNPYTAPPPFYGGQVTCAVYEVTARGVYNDGTVGSPSTNRFFGPITGTRVDVTRDGNYGRVISGGAAGTVGCNPAGTSEWIVAIDFSGKLTGLWITNIVRVDGQEDTGGNPPSPSLPPDNRSPGSYFHPGNSEYPPPTGYPAPPPAPNNYAPGGFLSRN